MPAPRSTEIELDVLELATVWSEGRIRAWLPWCCLPTDGQSCYPEFMGIYIGLFACPDRPGLVHEITGLVFRQRLNLTENQEFVDHSAQRFFMRTQFEGDVNPQKLEADFRTMVPEALTCQVRELKPRKLVLFASKEQHCLGDLLLRHCTGEFQAEILAVISQFPDCGQLVQRFGLPFCHIPFQKNQLQHEEEIRKVLHPLNPDYLVLARYMRIFSPAFVAQYPGQILNIHHSFLPAFIGKDAYQQAYTRGVKIVGATAHFVTADLDQGPIISQDVVAVDHSHSIAEMSRKGQDVEKTVLARGLNLVLEDRVLVDGNRTIVFAD